MQGFFANMDGPRIFKVLSMESISEGIECELDISLCKYEAVHVISTCGNIPIMKYGF